MTIDRYSTQRGLTLLEVLVVLLIAGMAIALGFQSLGQWRRAQQSITQVTSSLQEVDLAHSWWRESAEGLIADRARPFKGDSTSFSGSSLRPVTSHQGGATPLTWTLATSSMQWQLSLTENQSTLAIPLRDARKAEFGYLDALGKSHDTWPPKNGTHNHLPDAVLLTQEMPSGRTRIWVAAIRSSKTPLQLQFETDVD